MLQGLQESSNFYGAILDLKHKMQEQLSSLFTKNASDSEPEINENMKAMWSVANLTLSTQEIFQHGFESNKGYPVG